MARDDTMPVRHEPGFKEALSTMQRLKRAEDKKKQEANSTTFFILVFMALAIQLVKSDYEHSPQKWYDH